MPDSLEREVATFRSPNALEEGEAAMIPSLVCAALAVASIPASAGSSSDWNAARAQHLLNRAGFGGSADEIARFVAMGEEKAVESLFPDPSKTPPPIVLGRASLPGDLVDPVEGLATIEDRRQGYVRLLPDLIATLNRFGDWWIDRMVAHDDPVRDHMTIFWHGHFVSSVKEVGNPYAIIEQIRFLRANALGPFETLVRGIGRDGAMLRYLNNDTNVAAHANENWARELMELFSLGDGNYTEQDIKESARAFTGWSQESSHFVYHRLDHDFGQKTFLGTTGNFDGDMVIGIILRQPACGRFLANKIITYFEGVPPTAERAEDYAAFLRANQYDIGKMLKRLFHDPAFYREEVLADRVSGPIEYLVGSARRLGVAPPSQLVLAGGDMLGQKLFWPPSVKGWDGGTTWVTTAAMMHRSNVVGALLGVVDTEKLVSGAAADASDPMAGGGARVSKKLPQAGTGLGLIGFIQLSGWQPKVELHKALASIGTQPNDAAIAGRLVESLLAVPADAPVVAGVTEYLKSQREAAGIKEGELLAAGDKGEPILRRTAHLILSLPEAQLN